MGLSIHRSSLIAAGLFWLLSASTNQAASPRTDAYQRLLREASLALLKEGNNRFVEGQQQRPNQDSERRSHTFLEGQEPFATVLSCADSRVPVELLFDRGVGDLFVIRVAGNIAGDSELASIEYGVGHLTTPLLVVLGHYGCGAVSAVAHGDELHGNLHHLIGRIEPAVVEVRTQNVASNEFIPRAVEANVFHTISEILRHSDVVRAAVNAQGVQIVGAVYDLPSGRVKWLGPHPDQDKLASDAKPAPVETNEVVKSTEPEPAEEPTAAPRGKAARRPIPSAYLLSH